MGCDIHTYVEIRDKDGRWRAVAPDEPGRRGWAWGFRSRSSFCWAMLADVRNFDDIRPIAEPRGLPDDVSSEIRTTAEELEGHTHSWFTLQELLSFDYDALVTLTGTVTLAEFKEYLELGKPQTACGSGGHEISNAEMKRLALEGQSPDDPTVYCTKLAWSDTYRNNCWPVLAFMERLRREGPPERVRLVFWFDS